MAKSTGSFRFTQWDPIILILQIISMQALLYCSLNFIMFFMDILADANHTLDHIFQYHVSILRFMNSIHNFLYPIICLFISGNPCDGFNGPFNNMWFHN